MGLFGLPPLRPHFDAAVRDVAARDPLWRVQAAERLGDATEQERERATEALCRLLLDPDPRVRVAAVEAAGRLQTSDLCDPLIDRLDDPSSEVRQVAVLALTQLDVPHATDALCEAVGSDHPETRFQAVMSYVQRRPDDAEPLRPRIRDEDPMVRMNTAVALGESTDPVAAELLTECLADHNRSVRQRAAISLARGGHSTSVRDLVAALDEPDLILDALEALGHARDSTAADAIARLTHGVFRPLAVRAAAGAALARIGDPRGRAALHAVLTAWRPDGRSYAVELVGRYLLCDLVPELVALARRPRGTDPATLARSLANLLPVDARAKSALEALQNRGDEAAEIAKTALAMTGKPLE